MKELTLKYKSGIEGIKEGIFIGKTKNAEGKEVYTFRTELKEGEKALTGFALSQADAEKDIKLTPEQALATKKFLEAKQEVEAAFSRATFELVETEIETEEEVEEQEASN